jgi:hypothetical protein
LRRSIAEKHSAQHPYTLAARKSATCAELP